MFQAHTDDPSIAEELWQLSQLLMAALADGRISKREGVAIMVRIGAMQPTQNAIDWIVDWIEDLTCKDRQELQQAAANKRSAAAKAAAKGNHERAARRRKRAAELEERALIATCP